MTLRDQMDAAWGVYSQDVRYAQPPERFAFDAGFRAAIVALANPSDEMVERCAEVLKAADSWRTWKGPETHQLAARAVLKAAGGE